MNSLCNPASFGAHDPSGSAFGVAGMAGLTLKTQALEMSATYDSPLRGKTAVVLRELNSKKILKDGSSLSVNAFYFSRRKVKHTLLMMFSEKRMKKNPRIKPTDRHWTQWLTLYLNPLAFLF